jgi:PAS domain S-box-containing protein
MASKKSDIRTPFHDVAWRDLATRLDLLRGDDEKGPSRAARDAYELELNQIELEMQMRELHESRSLLEESQARYAKLYNQAPVAFVTLDGASTIVEANATATALFGRKLPELVGAPFRAAARVKDSRALGAHLRECLASRKQETCEVEWTTPAGEPGVLQLSTCTELSPEGVVLGYLMTVVDTTAIVRAKIEAVQLRDERHARAAADEANRLKDEFIALVSHEIRTPLNSILGWTQMIRFRAGDRTLLEHGLDVAERNARALAHIVDDILDVSRIVTGKLQFEMTETDLAYVAQSALETARPLACANGVQLAEAIAPDSVVLGDGARLQQVVSNLLSNALKFTRRGGRIQVILERVGPSLRLTVSDNGCGIAPQDLPHVFDTFRQADNSTRRRHGGLGLGLAIAQHIVHAHEGAISAQSEGPGWGTMITVELPAVSSPPSSRSSHRSLCMSPEALEGVKVLFVDDDTSSNELAELVLSDQGAVVMSANSVDGALELMHAFQPDVIVSDVAMPHRDGFDLVREVRKLSEPLGAVPLIAVTAYARAQDAARALEGGFTRHLAKPAEPRDLAGMICEVLGRA